MLTGKQSWQFNNTPVIVSTGVTGGSFESKGPLAKSFDLLYEDDYANEETHEKAHRKFLEEAMAIALKKGGALSKDVQFLLAGDLINQMTPTNFAARQAGIPTLGLYGACATSMEGLAMAAFLVNYEGAHFILTGASSHKGAVEKQFRYPNEYGGQKPPTSQRTVTGAGVALIGKKAGGSQKQPELFSATIGKVIDMGLSDPYDMGGAMAPAAVDTIMAHHRDLGLGPNYYDAIITGDLGKNGLTIAYGLMQEKGFKMDQARLMDCGTMIFGKEQQVFAGASGAGCSAAVLYGHLLNEMKKGIYSRILLVSTGALLSPLTFQQKETIPCIAHAVAIHY
ncbi:stage V sporulation protein AD [Bacillus testis]|uniref:stage V sporulation protein AD n=1 Tax=Bacillus testis TaxID=1622072 RepID=UPI00067F2B00|nr:stage V sporulation protein AD [Bacillus testis]